MSNGPYNTGHLNIRFRVKGQSGVIEQFVKTGGHVITYYAYIFSYF